MIGFYRSVFLCVQVILYAWEKGVNPSGNSTNPSNWDFSSSFFFAGTVVTTIGKQLDYIINHFSYWFLCAAAINTSCLVCRLWQPLSEHHVRSGVLCVLCTVWHPTEPGVSQTAGQVAHHPPGPTGARDGGSCSPQGMDLHSTMFCLNL